MGALAAPAIATLTQPISGYDKSVAIVDAYTGYDMYNKTFTWGHLLRGWGPFLGACVATYGIPKVVGIIRKL